MVIQAMKLRKGDILSDGSIVAAIIRSEGRTKAKLEDGRLLVAPDTYLLGVTRPAPQPAITAPPKGHGGELWA